MARKRKAKGTGKAKRARKAGKARQAAETVKTKPLDLKQTRLTSYSAYVDGQLRSREINELEHQLLMNEECGNLAKKKGWRDCMQIPAPKLRSKITESPKHMIGIVAVLLVIVAVMGIGLMTDMGSPTGFVVKQAEQTITETGFYQAYTERLLELDNVTSLRLTGYVEGKGAKMFLKTGEEELLIGEISGGEAGEEYAFTTDKGSYAVNETVTFIMTPERNSSVYVHFGNETVILDQENQTYSYSPTEAGEHRAVEIISMEEDIIRLEVNFTVIGNTTNGSEEPYTPASANYVPARELSFTAMCNQTCNMSAVSRPVLIIDPLDGSNVTITEMKVVTLTDNLAPVQVATIPDIVIRPGEEREIDLSPYFDDADDEDLFYEISELERIEGDTLGARLTLYAENETNESALVYATDGEHMILSNGFTIIASYDAPMEDETPAGIIESGNESVQNVSVSVPAAAEPADPCAAPNPNDRPLECLDGREYFQDQTIFINTVDRVPIARITPIGNLLIQGEVVEDAEFAPAANDYKIVYEDAYGLVHATVWFDSTTGNLYLKGKLYEENANIEPPPGVFTLKNKKGIVLAWANQGTGDLHIRGNVIPYRRDITK